jgi:hypothetical protein
MKQTIKLDMKNYNLPRKSCLTQSEKEARLYALAQKLRIKIGGSDSGLTERDSKG